MEDQIVSTLVNIEELLRELVRQKNKELSVLIDKSGLAELLLTSTATVDRLRAAGQSGPSPFRLGGDKVPLRWHRNEVIAWLGSRGPDGKLHDAQGWPGIWAKMSKKLS